MSPSSSSRNFPRPRQGSLLTFGVTGALALALTACNQSGSTMIAPPNDFSTAKATYYASTNEAPRTPIVYSNTGCSGYLCGHGYFPVYGYPDYFYRPAPGSRVELVTGGSSSYSASSPAEARANVARGGFGGTGHGSSS